MSDFCKRLAKCMSDGAMTVADVHHWFDRPRATVRTWVVDRRTPSGPSAKKARLLLELLERRIKSRGGGFPIPADLSVFDRPDYVRKLRHADSPRVSALHTAR